MNRIEPTILHEHLDVTRRYFLQMLGSGALLAATVEADAQLRVDLPRPKGPVVDYLTRDADFGTVERGDPLPYQQPEKKLREIGMTRDTWKLEVVADTTTGSKVERPMTIAGGNALDFPALMLLAEKHAVKYLKVITCNNLTSPLGIGLWEGVPLRELIWFTKPVSDIRRVTYYGHHNEDPKQMFRGSLSLGRVLEDPPGEYPVILAYKMNSEWLSGKRGGPVRMIVPEAYGFKSVKWLQRVTLTNLPGANDTYADENNDVDSWMKTYARFVQTPETIKSGAPLPISGIAQVGISGITRVQVSVVPTKSPMPADDPYLKSLPWQDAQILACPQVWGGGLPAGSLPRGTIGFTPDGGFPVSWPMRYSIAHWAIAIKDLKPGSYDLRCRTIDAHGIAQPMPRPLPKSGVNYIDKATVMVRSE
ncbi:MAG: molybdopterin-dependent oxidoreductase [Chthonomonadales bacterium]